MEKRFHIIIYFIWKLYISDNYIVTILLINL